MWLVISPSTDGCAAWACAGLQARGLSPLQWLNAETLAYSRQWLHAVSDEAVSAEVVLADGRRIRGDGIRGVLNRTAAAPIAATLLADPADRDYAAQEFMAFFVSWLHALPGQIVNRPTPLGLCGAWRHRAEWMWLAGQAGLPTPLYRQTDDDEPIGETGTPVQTALVIGERVIAAPPELHAGCLRLAALAACDVLGVDFTADAAGWWLFAGASPLPDLRLGGDASLDALAALLTRKSGAVQ